MCSSAVLYARLILDVLFNVDATATDLVYYTLPSDGHILVKSDIIFLTADTHFLCAYLRDNKHSTFIHSKTNGARGICVGLFLAWWARVRA